MKKLANGIQVSATKIDRECTGISAVIHWLLDQALMALSGTTGVAPAPTVEDVTCGAAC